MTRFNTRFSWGFEYFIIIHLAVKKEDAAFPASTILSKLDELDFVERLRINKPLISHQHGGIGLVVDGEFWSARSRIGKGGFNFV